MSDGEKNSVTVTIAGDPYTIRTEASAEHARACASLVDEAITDVLGRGALVEAHKAAILAALSIADQLLRERGTAESERDHRDRLAGRLASDLEAALRADDLASGA